MDTCIIKKTLMIWLLIRTCVLVTIKIALLTLFQPEHTQAIRRQRLALEQLDRILRQVRKAQMIHPSLLVSHYGSVAGYLKEQLLADDWYYMQFLTNANQAAPAWHSLPSH